MNQDEALRRIYNIMHADCVNKLLAGNDTECFSTQQYAAVKLKWLETYIPGDEPIEPEPIETARAHLSVSPIVIQVSPDVWKSR